MNKSNTLPKKIIFVKKFVQCGFTETTMRKTIFGTLDKLSTEELKNHAAKLSHEISNGVDLVYEMILEVLMYRLSEDDYISFCNTL